MKHKAVRRIQFCSGHRVYGHESKCATLHGHNYVVFFHAEADGLDKIGRVIDFSVLKERIGSWIDEHWDHTTILYAQDKKTIRLVEQCEKKKPTFILPTNPTAENMGEYLLKIVCPRALEDTGVIVTKVVVWETENCFAEVKRRRGYPMKLSEQEIERFLEKNAREIRRLKTEYLPEIVNERGGLKGSNGPPGVSEEVRKRADKIIKQAQEYGFFKNYQGFTSHKDYSCWFLKHSSNLPYNPKLFVRDVEFIHGEQAAMNRGVNIDQSVKAGEDIVLNNSNLNIGDVNEGNINQGVPEGFFSKLWNWVKGLLSK